jgi:hypothetical protein
MDNTQDHEIEVVPDLGTFHEDKAHHVEKIRLSDEQYALATQALPVVCTDVVLVDREGRFILFYRNHSAAKGWWWSGGSWKAELSREESIAKILLRELGFVPEKVMTLAVFDHFWVTRRELPHETGRHDIIFLHTVVVDEETIANIKLDPSEYDAGQGFMRYDGSQDVRPVVKKAYELFCSRNASQ